MIYNIFIVLSLLLVVSTMNEWIIINDYVFMTLWFYVAHFVEEQVYVLCKSLMAKCKCVIK